MRKQAAVTESNARPISSALVLPGEIERVRRLDRDAFVQLVREHESTVRSLARSTGLRGIDQDDAVTEAFAEVYRALPRFGGRSSFRTFIYRVAIRTLWRVRRRTKALPDGPIESPPVPGPGELLEQAERNQVIWDAVERLDPRQAMAVDLYYRQEMSVEEIADILDCPVGTAKTLLHRARAQLREALHRRGIQP